MAKTYFKREDGERRAGIAVWIHLTKEQVEEVERLLRASGTNVGLNDLLRKIAEDGIEKAIASGGEYLPTNRELWAFRKVG